MLAEKPIEEGLPPPPPAMAECLKEFLYTWRHLSFLVATVDVSGRADPLAVAATERLDSLAVPIARWAGVRID